MSTSPESLRILCFGASITAGFYSFGLNHHPYSKRLTQRLRTSLPSSKITIDTDALSGDRVIAGQYLQRLKRRLEGDAAQHYDWVILQGGGNDLGWGEDPSTIFEELRKLWKICLERGAKVLALTVTETGDQSRGTRGRYSMLNGLIKSHREDGFFVADVERDVPYASMDPAMRKKVWDDGLHFKPVGYDMLGDAIADRLLAVLRDGQPHEKL
ncbi:MAG: hypothetical protein LQ338_001588 [Usnochroma carphineum]|nr:MAG: hypothetical protein LQ338_001588 [Usnochroma carphineum]